MRQRNGNLALRHIGSSLLVALFLLLAGAALFLLSQQSMAKARFAQQQARTQASQQHDHYASTRRDEPLIRETIARFNTLSQQGLIGSENRLAWANAVRQHAEQARLNPIEFALAPRRSLLQLDAGGHFQLSASSMRVQLDLLHEGELLRFLDDLSQRTDALVIPRTCSLSSSPATNHGEAVRLRSECELDWITITPAPSLSQQP